MTVLRLALAACAAVAALAGAAEAAASFSRADTNHDGVVEWPEARNALPRLKKPHYERCDANGDGVIDQGEYALLNSFYWNVYQSRR